MAERIINSRIVNKHETEANWLKSSLIPKQGELIVYDIDENYDFERIKIGDGTQNVNSLPFVTDAVRTELLEQIGVVDGKVDAVSALVGDTAVADQISDAISAVSTLVGDKSVSEQISNAIDDATADDFGVYVQDTEPTEAVSGDIWIDTANDPSYIPPTIPAITAADNGKVLMVVNGTLQLVDLSLSIDANGVVSM